MRLIKLALAKCPFCGGHPQLATGFGEFPDAKPPVIFAYLRCEYCDLTMDGRTSPRFRVEAKHTMAQAITETRWEAKELETRWNRCVEAPHA